MQKKGIKKIIRNLVWREKKNEQEGKIRRPKTALAFSKGRTISNPPLLCDLFSLVLLSNISFTSQVLSATLLASSSLPLWKMTTYGCRRTDQNVLRFGLIWDQSKDGPKA